MTLKKHLGTAAKSTAAGTAAGGVASLTLGSLGLAGGAIGAVALTLPVFLVMGALAGLAAGGIFISGKLRGRNDRS